MANGRMVLVCLVLCALAVDAQRRRGRIRQDNANHTALERKSDQMIELEDESRDIINILNTMNDKLSSISTSNEYQLRKSEIFEYRLSKIEVQLQEKTDSLRSDIKEISKGMRQIEWTNSATESLLDNIKADVATLKQSQTKEVAGSNEGLGSTSKMEIILENVQNLQNTLVNLQFEVYGMKTNMSQLTKSLSSLQELQPGLERACDISRPVRHNPTGPLPQDCSQVKGSDSGVYIVQPPHSPAPFFVYCDLVTAGGGWTVIQNRIDGSQEFFKDWHDYKRGFGNIAAEFWLGLDKMHELTNYHVNELYITLEDTNSSMAYAHYSNFAIGSEMDGFPISFLGGYKGTAGDSLMYHAGQRFSTFDKDNDGWAEGNCAQSHLGAWWYNSCDSSNLNGRYLNGELPENLMYIGLYWQSFGGPSQSLKSSRIMIRPRKAHRQHNSEDSTRIPF